MATNNDDSNDKFIISGHDDFVESCMNSVDFPANLVQSRFPRRVLETMGQKLEEESKHVFNKDNSSLKFMDIYPQGKSSHDTSVGVQNPEEHTTSINRFKAESQRKLEDYVQRSQKDPHFRYVSMRSGSSRDPVNCSPDMFKYLCSYQQIPPSFMDCVFSFRQTMDDYDCGLAVFSDENTLLNRPEQLLLLPKLGRSGREIRHSFLLRSVEKSNSLPDRNYVIRHLAVYHCFDVITGRTTWVTLKANDVVENRINDHITGIQETKPQALQNVYEAFAVTLETHTMIIDWCDENWRWFINEIAASSKEETSYARTIPVDDDPPQGVLREYTRRGTGMTGMSEVQQIESFWRSFGSQVQHIVGLCKPSTPQSVSLQDLRRKPQEDVEQGHQDLLNLEKDVKTFQKTDKFKIRGVQKLQSIMERIEETLLVLDLNGKVLRKMREHYQDLTSRYRIKEMEAINKHCGNDIQRFLSRVRTVEENIAIRKSQLQSRLSLVREGRTTYDAIIQHRGIQVSRMYAGIAQQSADNMHQIALKTKRETSSMHVITFVTLIFLPGTFIASLFQSGIMKMEEEETIPTLNWGAFKLFLIICIPLMALTILVWLGIYCMGSRNTQVKSSTKVS